jgi:hypothetical protein
VRTSRPAIRLVAFLALLAGCLAAGFSADAALPSMQPLLQGKWPRWPRRDAWDVKVVGSYAYVAAHSSGLAVIDVSNPTNCVQLGGCDTLGYAIGVAVSGNYAYVADATNGLQVIDVSDPARCVRVGGFITSAEARDVAVSGNYAYVAAYDAGLQVIDVRDPAAASAWAAITPTFPGESLVWRCRGTTPTSRGRPRGCMSLT